MADERQNRLSMVVFSGDMDKLIAAYIIATGAAAFGMEVVMFHTFWGLKALQKNEPTGKSFFGKMLGKIYGGDITKANPSRYGFGGMGRWMFNRMMKSKNVSSLKELRQTAIDLGVKMYGCQMSMDVMEIPREKMIDEVEGCVGVGFFLEQAKDSKISLFI